MYCSGTIHLQIRSWDEKQNIGANLRRAQRQVTWVKPCSQGLKEEEGRDRAEKQLLQAFAQDVLRRAAWYTGIETGQ